MWTTTLSSRKTLWIPRSLFSHNKRMNKRTIRIILLRSKNRVVQQICKGSSRINGVFKMLVWIRTNGAIKEFIRITISRKEGKQFQNRVLVSHYNSHKCRNNSNRKFFKWINHCHKTKYINNRWDCNKMWFQCSLSRKNSPAIFKTPSPVPLRLLNCTNSLLKNCKQVNIRLLSLIDAADWIIDIR
jgi:hypothetical protein